MEYRGRELDVFRMAHHWKRYVGALVAPHLGRRVLEVGAGIGGTTRVLCDGAATDAWLCLEPDPRQADILRQLIRGGDLPACCEVAQETVRDLPAGARFDTVLYMDVLEHIRDDAVEVRCALDHVAPGGALVVLAPAHQRLFSAFDREVGHYRRYDRSSLLALAPPDVTCRTCRYLDSVGILLSLANRHLLRKTVPRERDILFWDRIVVPVSRLVDPRCGYRLGKSILAVWRKRGDGE